MSNYKSEVLSKVCKKTIALIGLVLFFTSINGYADNGRRNNGHFQVVNLQSFVDNSYTLGAARLVRRKSTLEANVNVSGLDPSGAYTIWWAIYNFPGACATSPCGFSDLFNPDTGAAVFYAAGLITGTDGVANVSINLRSGKLPEGVPSLDLGTGVKPELLKRRVLKAEVQLALRTHGALIPGTIDAQTGSHTSSPGCCTDQQFAVFPAID